MIARDRRALLFGGAMVLAAVVALRVAPWGIARAVAAEGELRERATLLARARADLADAPLLRDSAGVLTRAVIGLAPRLLSGDTPTEALADLSGRLTLAASRSQAKLERTDQLADSTAAGRLRRVRVRTALESDIRGVMGFLRAVELGDAVLSIEEARIVAADPGSGEQLPEILRAEVTVTGWFLVRRETLKDSLTVAGKGKGET